MFFLQDLRTKTPVHSFTMGTAIASRDPPCKHINAEIMEGGRYEALQAEGAGSASAGYSQIELCNPVIFQSDQNLAEPQGIEHASIASLICRRRKRCASEDAAKTINFGVMRE